MNETKKTAIVMGLVILFLLIIPIAMMFKSGEGKDIISKVEALVNSKEPQIIYIGSKDCVHCVKFNPIIENASKTNNFKYNYFDIVSLTQTQKYNLAKIFGKENEGIGTPHTVIAKEGKIIAELSGFVEEDKLLEFLVTNKIIEKAVATPNTSSLKMIGYSEYAALLESETPRIIVLAQSTCPACIQTKPILEAIASEKKIEINYFDVDKMSSEDYKKMSETLPLFKEEWYTPTTIVVSKKAMLDKVVGAAEKTAYIDFFTKNGIIK